MSHVVTVPELLDGHAVLDVECVDRIYLTGYVPMLQVGGQARACGGNPARERAGRAAVPCRRCCRGRDEWGACPRPGGAFLRLGLWSHCPNLLAGCRHS